jgi:hypothetical protein
MKNARIHNLGARRSIGEGPNPETALFLAASAFGLAMISLLAVLALADIVELAHILPFFSLPLVLFIASAPLLRRWVKGEAEEAATREAALRSSKRPSPELAPTATDGLDARRLPLKPTSAIRRRLEQW